MKALLALSLAIATAHGAHAGQQKPTPKPQAGPAVQMPGDAGKVGVPYSMGAKGDELVFTLEKAQFSSRAFTSDDAVFAYEGERLLIVTLAVQNPGKADRYFSHASFKFTVVSPNDQNYLMNGYLYNPDTLAVVEGQIKPAQKVRAWFAVKIHPKGVVNKLIVERGTGNKVLRYDLRDKVTPMVGPYADDNGMDILEMGRIKVGTPFGMGWFDYNVEKVEEVTGASNGFTPGAGNKLFIVTMTVKNAAKINSTFGPGMLQPKLLDEDGDEVRLTAMAKTSSEDPPAHQSYSPDQQMRFRFVFEMRAAAKPAVLQLRDAGLGKSVALKVN
jgi:hypothetical protein